MTRLPKALPRAELRSKRFPLCIALLIITGLLWSARHVESTEAIIDGHPHEFAALWVIVFVSLTWHLTLAWCERRYVVTPRQQRQIDRLRVTCNVPVYNEDPEVLVRVVQALFAQTRPINRIQVVDDGSTIGDYGPAIREFYRLAAYHPEVRADWVTKSNGGKRSAQLMTFRGDRAADIFMTMDSDVVLDPCAVEEGLKPFADARVTSVASVILAYNTRASILTRFTDPWLMAFQLCVRSALSTLGSVLVNSGNSAFYRAQVVRDAFDSYEGELFLGRPVQFSDDSLLTLFAYLRGRTVQQPTSFAFTVLPENLSHHLRQQLRWMRGSFIRSWWRFKYLPFRSFAYWEHFASWMNFVLVTMAFTILFIWQPIVDRQAIPVLFIFAVLVAYATALKYLTIRRTDQSFKYQFATFAMTPVMLVWTALLLRPLRLYSMLTARRTGWGTRDEVEVQLA